jgi:hypothetical protein
MVLDIGDMDLVVMAIERVAMAQKNESKILKITIKIEKHEGN